MSRRVAAILAKRFSEAAILYDKFHEAEFARGDLAIYLPDLYHEQADLVVAVVCPDYDKKEWIGLEWDAIHDLLKAPQRRTRSCSPASVARRSKVSTRSRRLSELDDKTPEQAANLILERLALNEGHPKEHYLTIPRRQRRHSGHRHPQQSPAPPLLFRPRRRN